MLATYCQHVVDSIELLPAPADSDLTGIGPDIEWLLMAHLMHISVAGKVAFIHPVRRADPA
jgi:hypothetical protein